MLGAFRPTSSLSGGLLWKIPWRLSPHQKLRHRRRLRKVDSVVSVLDSALRRQAQGASASTSSAIRSGNAPPPPSTGHLNATPEELSTTAEGQRMLAREAQSEIQSHRHGRGPREGDIHPSSQSKSSQASSRLSRASQPPVMLGDVSRGMGTIKLIERWKAEMPTEGEMLAKDKYSMFDRKAKGYRKGVHKLPKWTRVSQRLNPPGF